MSKDPCKNCPNIEICFENHITPEECQDINIYDPDYENLYNRKSYGEYYWGEFSYNKYVDTSLDYGDYEEYIDEDK